MELSIIPWQVFLDALHKQQSGTVELWLRSWLFSNEGVMLADESFATTDYSSVPRWVIKSFSNCKMAGMNVFPPSKTAAS